MSSDKLPNVNYSVRVTYIDNQVDIIVNGATLLTQRGNNSTNINQSISEFLHSGKNTLVVRGWNEAYLPGWHDPNPALVNYEILRNTNPSSDVTSVSCSGPDSRVNSWVIFFTHTYEINYP